MFSEGEAHTMATGIVVRFDGDRGYGFIEPDDGGEDVFLHASVLDDDVKSLMRIGKRVQFDAVGGERGRKAFDVRVLDIPLPAPRTVPADPPAAAPLVPAQAPAAKQAPQPEPEPAEDTCDVLTAREFTNEITERLLETVPSLTGEQIVAIRNTFVALADEHGWIEE
jgi:cold shock CspA family protein